MDPTTTPFSYLLNVDLDPIACNKYAYPNNDYSLLVPSLPPMYEDDSLDGASGGLSDYMGIINGTDSGIGGMVYGGGIVTAVPSVHSSMGQTEDTDSSSFKTRLRLSAEERKEKIQKYMKKRNERNFTKKIKYACRKTLADSRPRVRGRFAKESNEEFIGDRATPNYLLNNDYFDVVNEQKMELKEEDMFESSDIYAHISGINSFGYKYTVESWM